MKSDPCWRRTHECLGKGRHPVVAEWQTRTFGLCCLEWCSAVRYYSAQWGKMSYMLPASALYIPCSGSDFEVRCRLCSPAPKITLLLRVPMTFSKEVAQAQWNMSGCLCCMFPGAGSLEDNWEKAQFIIWFKSMFLNADIFIDSCSCTCCVDFCYVLHMKFLLESELSAADNPLLLQYHCQKLWPQKNKEYLWWRILSSYLPVAFFLLQIAANPCFRVHR